jgi:hypothetical protein
MIVNEQQDSAPHVCKNWPQGLIYCKVLSISLNTPAVIGGIASVRRLMLIGWHSACLCCCTIRNISLQCGVHILHVNQRASQVHE